MALEPNLYVERAKQMSQHAQVQPVVAQKTSPIVYGKRPGSAISAPPRKILNTTYNGVYSPRLAPTPPFKYDASMLAAASALNGSYFNFVKDKIGTNLLEPCSSLIQLTPPKTPEVK